MCKELGKKCKIQHFSPVLIVVLMRYNISLYVILFSDDHTLVQLRPLPGSRRPEYINASFIDGFQKSRAYIATQVSPHSQEVMKLFL